MSHAQHHAASAQPAAPTPPHDSAPATPVAPLVRRRRLRATATVLVSVVATMLALLPLSGPAEAAQGHRIRRGETLSQLHHRFHRSVRCLARRNHIRHRNHIRAGRWLVIPSRAWCRHHARSHHRRHHHRRHHHRRHHHRAARPSRSGSRAPLTGAQTVSAFKSWARAQVGSSQFPALNALWMHESGWNRYATNPSSGAYGIPQALPATKMASAGADWRWNGYTQMRWGLAYIRARYGSPANAWSFWQAHHWY